MISDPPLVSAVIPVFNGREFIAEAIQSVLDQSYPRLECLVVDDGSEDDTRECVRSFGDRVRLIGQPNQGVAAARNNGISNANGTFVAFLDADDVWLPEKTARQIALFQERPSLGLVHSSYYVVDEQMTRLGKVEAPEESVALRNTVMLRPPTINLAQTAIVPVDVLNEVGSFDPRLSTSADLDLALRIGIRFEVGSIHEPLATYRRREAQMSSDVALMEHDMHLVYSTFFSRVDLPPELKALRSRAYANLELVLSASNLRQGKRRRAMRHLLHAIRHNPIHTAREVVKRAV